MAQYLGTVATFEEDLSSIPSTHIVAHNFSVTLVPLESDTFFCSSWAAGMLILQYACMHANTHTHKIKSTYLKIRENPYVNLM